jgi:hypothetical protein
MEQAPVPVVVIDGAKEIGASVELLPDGAVKGHAHVVTTRDPGQKIHFICIVSMIERLWVRSQRQNVRPGTIRTFRRSTRHLVLQPQNVQEILGHVMILFQENDRPFVVANELYFLKNEVGLPPPMMLRLTVTCLSVMAVQIRPFRIHTSGRFGSVNKTKFFRNLNFKTFELKVLSKKLNFVRDSPLQVPGTSFDH